MKRKILSFMALLSFLAAFGETISQKQAMQLASMFFNEAAGQVIAPPKLIYNGRRLTTNRLFTPFYVYNSPKGGFVIISADNKAYPILGFSLRETFDQDKLGGTELALLKSYAREIEFIRYDSEPIDSTVWSWTHYAEYVRGILDSKYLATDPIISTEEALQMINIDLEKDNVVYSDLYTPEQWRDILIKELIVKKSIPIALLGESDLYPAVIYGHQGDYFRIEMTTRNNWLMRLNATEIIPSNMISTIVMPEQRNNLLDEEIPFAEHDEFLAEVVETESQRMSTAFSPMSLIKENTPFVRSNGGGHFEIILPEKVETARIYNLSGTLVRKYGYNDTISANIDLSSEPYGFYILTLMGESGNIYGLKLYR